MSTNPTAYPLAGAELLDAAIAALNARLGDGTLTWLNAAFGQVQKLKGERDGRTFDYPGIYAGGTGSGDYLDLLPDLHLASLGGYSFWHVNEPVTVEHWKHNLGRLEAQAALIVWFDFRKVYPADWKGRSVWNVIQDVLDVLSTGTGMANFGDELEFFYSGETIYRGYTHNEIERQFLMKPYGGFRIEGTIFFNKTC
jgi:hypothetical protein